jgi:hypothetical protein
MGVHAGPETESITHGLSGVNILNQGIFKMMVPLVGRRSAIRLFW